MLPRQQSDIQLMEYQEKQATLINGEQISTNIQNDLVPDLYQIINEPNTRVENTPGNILEQIYNREENI